MNEIGGANIEEYVVEKPKSEEKDSRDVILQSHQKGKTKKNKIRTKSLKQCSSTVQPQTSTPNVEEFSGDRKSGGTEKKSPLKYCLFITSHPFISFGKYVLIRRIYFL